MPNPTSQIATLHNSWNTGHTIQKSLNLVLENNWPKLNTVLFHQKESKKLKKKVQLFPSNLGNSHRKNQDYL